MEDDPETLTELRMKLPAEMENIVIALLLTSNEIESKRRVFPEKVNQVFPEVMLGVMVIEALLYGWKLSL